MILKEHEAITRSDHPPISLTCFSEQIASTLRRTGATAALHRADFVGDELVANNVRALGDVQSFLRHICKHAQAPLIVSRTGTRESH